MPGSPYNWRTTYHSTLDAEYGPKEEHTQVNLAFVISDELFGNAPMRQLNDFSEIRPGDLLHLGGDYWSFAAARPVEKDGWLYVTTIGHGANGTINWHDGDIGRVCLNSNYKGAYTRYPEGTSTSPIVTVSTPSSIFNFSTTDFSEEYMSSKYYRQLQEVTLTGNYREDILAVAASQIGYSEGNRESEIDGSYSGSGNYTEYGRYMGSNGSAWCSEFASWCARMAGVPSDILHSSRSANVETFAAPYYGWSQTVFANGSYTPRPGDLALFAWDGTSPKAKNLSHTTIVKNVAVSGNIVTVTVIDGNSNGTVREHSYTVNTSNGYMGRGYLVYFVAPDYD